MNTQAFIQVGTRTGTRLEQGRKRILAKAQAAGAAVGLVGSVAVALTGSLLMAAGWLVANEGVGHWLSATGSVLLFLTIPLLVLAAYCLDWMEKDEPHYQSKVLRYEEDEDDE